MTKITQNDEMMKVFTFTMFLLNYLKSNTIVSSFI